MTQSLSAEEIAELKLVCAMAINEPTLTLATADVDALLAMASRLVNLESALEFLANDSELFDVWREGESVHLATPYGDDGVAADDAASAILRYAKERGWPGPTSQAKGG